MLVLSRKTQETIVFPQLGITITIVGAEGRVKVGIEAPREVQILRGELEVNAVTGSGCDESGQTSL